MPRPQLLFAPQPVVCLQKLLLAPCKGRKNNWLPGKQTGIKYFAQLFTMRAEACLCHYRSDKEQPPCLPFHPSCPPAATTGSSPVFSWFHHCHDVAKRRMLLMLAWLQPCQRNGNLWENLEEFDPLFSTDLCFRAERVLSRAMWIKFSFFPPRCFTTTTAWEKVAMVPALKVPCGRSPGTKVSSWRKCSPAWDVLQHSPRTTLITPVAFPDLCPSEKTP